MNHPYSSYGGNPNAGRNPNAENGWGAYRWPSGVPAGKLATAKYGNVGLTVRTELVQLVTLLLQATETKFGYNLYGPNEKPPAGWCWGYSNRAIAGTSTASNHSKGRAVDLNAPANPYTSPLVCDIPPGAVNTWERAGFFWGGRYSGSKDAMHFEYCWTPGDVGRHVAYVRGVLGAAAASKPAAPAASRPQAAGRHPFPLPPGYYFGALSGPAQSISGMARSGSDAKYRPHIKRIQRVVGVAQDGLYGPGSIAATRRWQSAHHVAADGLVGPVTWAAMGL